MSEKYLHLMSGLFIGALLSNITVRSVKKNKNKPQESISIAIYTHAYSILLFYANVVGLPNTNTKMSDIMKWDYMSDNWKGGMAFLPWICPVQIKSMEYLKVHPLANEAVIGFLLADSTYWKQYAHCISMIFLAYGICIEKVSSNKILYRYSEKIIHAYKREDWVKMTHVIYSLIAFG